MAAPRPALPRVVELVRVSSRGQADRDTPQDQRAALDRLMLSRPGVVVRRIEYQGSGAAPGASRPDLLELAALARTRSFDELRVRHLDRLTRHEDPRERYAVFGLVADAGAVIVDAGGHVIDPASEMGELDFGFQSIIASRERRRILERTMAGKRRLAAAGRLVVGRPPWGRTWDPASGTWGIEPVALAEYRRLFDLVLAGGSTRGIAARLNSEGSTTPTGRAWSAGTVHRLIRAPHAAGRFQSHGATIEIPPVVSPATQAEAVARLTALDKSGGRHAAQPALLRRIVACGVCHHPLHTDSARKPGHPSPVRRYYRCRTPGCGGLHHLAVVDDAVKATLAAWLARPASLEAAAGSEEVQGQERAKKAIRRARLDLRRVAVEEERTARHLARGLITPRAAEVVAGEQARDRQRAEQAIAQAQAELAAEERWATQASDLAARVEAIRVGLGAAGHEDWRRVVEALFGPRGVLLYPDGTLELRGSVAVGSDLAPVRLSARARRG